MYYEVINFNLSDIIINQNIVQEIENTNHVQIIQGSQSSRDKYI